MSRVLIPACSDACLTWNIGSASGAALSAAQSAARCAALRVAPAPASTGDSPVEHSRLPALHEVIRVVGIARMVIWVQTGAGATVQAMPSDMMSSRSTGDEMKKTTTAKRTTKARAMIRCRTRIGAVRR